MNLFRKCMCGMLIIGFLGMMPARSSAGGDIPTTRPAMLAFNLNGVPIHPMSVAPLVAYMADEQPVIAAVDLTASARNKSNRAEVMVENGLLTALDGEGFVAYRTIGMTPGGIWVLVVMVSGGGSGVFEDALWVTIVRDTVWENGKKRDRTMLKKVGAFTLGDRDDGEVKLDHGNLLIGKSRYRQKATTIPLD